MKKILAVCVAAIFTVMFAGPAVACPVEVKCDSTPEWTYGWDHANTVTASLTVDAESSGLCAPVTLQATSYTVPGTWDRKGFNLTAVPQTAIQPQRPMTFPIGAKSSTQASTLNTPPCGPYQVDLYGGVALESIDKNGTPDFRAGGLVDRPNCPTPVVPVAPTWTPGTCLAEGTVTLEQNPSYIWSFVETENGRDYTATATPGHAITTQGPWPVKIAQLSPDSPECLPAVLPVSVITQAQVTPIPPTCDADGSLTLTNGESYTWSDTRPLAVGRHEVIATAAAGYVFSDLETTATFTVEVLAATGDQSTDATAGCYVADVPPVVDPPVVDPPVVVPVIVVPVVTPVAVVASKTVASKTVASKTPAVNNRVLAYTGIDGLPWLLLGAAGLIGFGGLTVSRASRERRVRA